MQECRLINSNKLDFISCANIDDFCKSSHIRIILQWQWQWRTAWLFGIELHQPIAKELPLMTCYHRWLLHHSSANESELSLATYYSGGKIVRESYVSMKIFCLEINYQWKIFCVCTGNKGCISRLHVLPDQIVHSYLAQEYRVTRWQINTISKYHVKV